MNIPVELEAVGGHIALPEHTEGQVDGRRAAVKSEGGERRRRAARIGGFEKKKKKQRRATSGSYNNNEKSDSWVGPTEPSRAAIGSGPVRPQAAE